MTGVCADGLITNAEQTRDRNHGTAPHDASSTNTAYTWRVLLDGYRHRVGCHASRFDDKWHGVAARSVVRYLDVHLI